MRYFVVMQDHTIKPATDVTKCESTDRIYFRVDNKMYRYLTVIREYDCKRFSHIRIPAPAFQQFLHDSWFETREIKYIIALDEEENEELNYFQSTDFNAGMLYSAVEKKAVTMLKETNEKKTSGTYHIPNIQVVPNGCDLVDDSKVIETTIKAATDHFNAVYGKTLELDIYAWQRVKQYCAFFYRISKKEVHKEMTVAEIEEALGYKIKVISE